MATITNQATLSYSGGVTNSNVTTGELVEAVSASLLAVTETYAPDENLSFVLSLVNASAAAVTGLEVSVDLGAYPLEEATLYPLSYVEGSLVYLVDGAPTAPAPTVTAGPPMTISGIDIPAEANVTLIFVTRATAYAPLGEGASITVTAAVTGSCIVTPITVSAEAAAEAEPVLTIAKSMFPEVLTGCEEVTYSFVIQNSGSVEAGAAANAVVSDTFSPVLTNLTAAFNGADWASPADYSYDTQTGRFTTQPGALTVPAATYTRNTDGTYSVNPGVSTLTVTGRLG